MQKTLKNLYFGNIRPCEQRMPFNSDLRRVLDKAARCERELTERLGEADQTLLTELVNAQQQIDSITAQENFVQGFRLGVRVVAECMVENDDDT